MPPFNGSGTFTPPGANYPAVAATLITAANRNGVDADLLNQVAVRKLLASVAAGFYQVSDG